MLVEMTDMLAKLERVCVMIYPADSEGRYTLSLSCKAQGKAGESVKSIEEMAPLRIHGTAEEIDEKLGQTVAIWGGALGKHFDNMEAIDKQIAEAEAEAKKKTRKKAPANKKAPSKRAVKKEADAKEDAERLAAIKSDGPRFGSEPTPKPEPAKPEPKAEKTDDLLAELLG
ncbi:MAG: hypothetical protein Unbinned3806contig1000_68 [Prokaryotic dsDNA virus sp.]|nr:MAG: hypothetical protein Unbinned3806contig1000_68 [Prokaryotic dsDNA virus sp.]|tara:strand:+ start:9601 stop:10113 length:513 start_codon:yes stop_codon:yes gene_type:complete